MMQFEAVLEAAPDAIVAVDQTGVIRLVNHQTELLFGYDRAELVGQQIEVLVPESFRAAHPAHRERYFADPVTRPMGAGLKLTGRRRDGTEFPVDIALSSIDTADGLLVTASVRDMTERKKVQAKFEALLEAAPDAIVGVDQTGVIRLVNRQTELLFGYDRAELVGQQIEVLVPESFRAAHPAHRERYFADPVTRPMGAGLKLTGRRRDGTEFPVDISLSSIDTEDGLLVMASLRDITERRLADEALHRMAAVIVSTDDAILVKTLDGIITGWNSGAERLYGYAAAEVIGRSVALLVPPGGVDEVPDMLRRIGRGEKGMNYETTRVGKDGKLIDVSLTFSAIRDLRGAIVGASTIARDVTRRRQAERELAASAKTILALNANLAHQALHDPLTGLPNRLLVKDRLTQALARSQRHGSGVALLFIDLDRFKLVNDSLGHSAGDELLVAVGDRLRGVVRRPDTAGRLAGDEFVLVCEELANPEEALAIADRVSEALAPPIRVGDRELTLTASVGIAVALGPQTTADSLIGDADVAMYAAKKRGGNDYEVFDEAMRVPLLERFEIEADLRRALDRNELLVFYQPQVSLATGALVGFEALVRWEHPRRGLIGPSDFIPVAENTGLIHRIGAWVLGESCRQAAVWATRHPELLMAVNLSAHQATDPELVETVNRVLTETSLDPRALCVEITETALMDSWEPTARALAELRKLGLLVSIDDLGTGYASLTYIAQFHPDVLKVDRSFVQDVVTDPGSTAIVTATVGLAHSLGLTAIGEGVETAEQLAALRRIGCDQAQGYLFGQAQPSGVVAEMLADRGRHWTW